MPMVMNAQYLPTVPEAQQVALRAWIDEVLTEFGFDSSDVLSVSQEQGGYVFEVMEKNIAGRHYVHNGEIAMSRVVVHCAPPPDLDLDPDVARLLAVL